MNGRAYFSGNITETTPIPQGLNVAWNLDMTIFGGTIYLNARGGGSGGHHFYDVPGSGGNASTRVRIASFTDFNGIILCKNVSTSGTVSVGSSLSTATSATIGTTFSVGGTSTLQATNVLSLSSSGTVTCPYLSVTTSALVSGLLTTGSISSSGPIVASLLTSSGSLNCGSIYVNGGGSGMYFTMASGLSNSTVLRQGNHWSWNTFNGSTGEMDIVCKSGGGTGGIYFWNSTGDNSTFSTGQTLMARMTTSGFVANNVTSSGTISSVGNATIGGTLSAGVTTISNNLTVSRGTIQMNGNMTDATVATQGTYIAWNPSGGLGETAIYTKSGTGSNPGLFVYNSTGTGTVMSTNKTLIASMTTSGTAIFGKLSSSGPLTATTGTFSSTITSSGALNCAAATCTSLQCNGDITATGYIRCKPITSLMVYNSSFNVTANAGILATLYQFYSPTITGNPYGGSYGWVSGGFYCPLDGIVQFTFTFRMADGSGGIGIKPYINATSLLPSDGTYWIESDPSNRRNTCYTIVVPVTQYQSFDLLLNAGSTQTFQYMRAHGYYIST